MEYQRRGVVHFHLLCYGVEYLKLLVWPDAELRRVVTSTGKDVEVSPCALWWCECSGQADDNDALAASVRVEKLRDYRGVMSYCAKYIGKSSDDNGEGEVVLDGRVWGIAGRRFLPLGVPIQLALDEQGSIDWARLARRGSKGRVSARWRRGWYWLVDGSAIAAVLEGAGGRVAEVGLVIYSNLSGAAAHSTKLAEVLRPFQWSLWDVPDDCGGELAE